MNTRNLSSSFIKTATIPKFVNLLNQQKQSSSEYGTSVVRYFILGITVGPLPLSTPTPKRGNWKKSFD